EMRPDRQNRPRGARSGTAATARRKRLLQLPDEAVRGGRDRRSGRGLRGLGPFFSGSNSGGRVPNYLADLPILNLDERGERVSPRGRAGGEKRGRPRLSLNGGPVAPGKSGPPARFLAEEPTPRYAPKQALGKQRPGPRRADPAPGRAR